ncbi:Transcriptional regulator containing GAF, AAA-type ATPase, and DNA-binding Fis domains [Maridesulfovibrio ferrireducens]|uniref:Transcriptional regulator containing GAF, AAA-type ATPase, and DNA-binding Fis domains n=1 Tax=Maridesulfovibrio ferrireducens TaxID=246191 RepID=A0A1G9D2D9_9BACT|nr:sigma-54-dependent Fis family transcriptional regulator [Maridesulfovibrio ferrireducens]SDK58049.1 Transcriptional regulator containing GAF, AAA-type ATPase, and DNA-binding Fis domains [Maridesulfovibrio ferrireducens]
MTISIDDYKELSQELDPEKLQKTILNLLLKLQNVERGSLWIERDNMYECVEALGHQSEELKGIKLNPNKKSIVGWVIQNGKMTIAEAGADTRHNSQFEHNFKVKSKHILCFPLLLKGKEVYGAVQVIDTSSDGDHLNLNPEYLTMLQDVVDIGSIALRNSLEFQTQQRKYAQLSRTLSCLREKNSIVGKSASVNKALKLVKNYAATNYPVLISGESGTGKELFAQEIHAQSGRADKPFLTQNCSAIPENLLESELFGYVKGAFTGATANKLGLFEAADEGTVFLDEIGDMDINLQAKVLRVLQENEIKPLGGTRTRKVNVRIISATNRKLEEEVRSGRFREDLYYRLNVLPLKLPNLNERQEDIPLLTEYFLTREASFSHMLPKKLTPEARTAMKSHKWPGNIRELENAVKQFQAMVPGDTIQLADLPPHIASPVTTPSISTLTQKRGSALRSSSKETPAMDISVLTWTELESTYVLKLLEKHKWNVSQAARAANLNRSTFDSRMKKLGITKNIDQ